MPEIKSHFEKDNGHLDRVSAEEAKLLEFMASNLDEAEHHYRSIHNKFVNKSKWRPPRIHSSLEVLQRAFKNGLLKSQCKGNRCKNLSKSQITGLRNRCQNPDIAIKMADKGSAVVVLNTTDHLREGYRQLSDEKFYKS